MRMKAVQTASFLVRRARRLLGMTQTQIADHLGVEQSTVSRWERGLQQPSPEAQAELERVCDHHVPALSMRFLTASPVPKIFTEISDFAKHVTYSAGAERLISEAGSTLDMWGAYATPVALACNEHVATDPRWLSGEIAFFEVKALNRYSAVSPLVPVHTVCAPLHQCGLAVFEGVRLDALTEPPYIRLHLVGGTTETILL